MKRSIGLVIFLLIVSPVLAQEPAESGGLIVFASDRDGDLEIYIMNADGSDPRNLTNNDAADVTPAWSPDGSQIVFMSQRDDDAEIYVMNADGSDQRNLTNTSGWDSDPAWSPNGSQIVFESSRDDVAEIYVMNGGGSDLRNLTNTSARDSYPVWSPDGSQIAFVSDRDGAYEIYVMNADGSDLRNLTANDAYDDDPAWSPDGAQIIFRSDRDGNNEIYIMNADGSDPHNLTNSSGQDGDATWSPDGSQIAFWSIRDNGNDEIYIMNADGSDPRNLTNSSGIEGYPVWSADGTQIMFEYRMGTGNGEIYVVNVDGSGLLNLTKGEGKFNNSAVWQPGPGSTATPVAAALTPIPAGSSNADWTPEIQEFGGVEMVFVPAGCFMMGTENSADDEKPVHEVCLDAFWIDRTEVTSAEFAALNGQSVANSYFLGDNHPREQISWFEANDFCASRGGRLPTEAEWEYAARGPEGLFYPWGNEFIEDNVVFYGNSDGSTADVNSKPGGTSWVGASDMSGNVWEWLADWYGPYESGKQTNPTGPASGEFRVVRGGSWLYGGGDYRTADREGVHPDWWSNEYGFRCALTP